LEHGSTGPPRGNGSLRVAFSLVVVLFAVFLVFRFFRFFRFFVFLVSVFGNFSKQGAGGSDQAISGNC